MRPVLFHWRRYTVYSYPAMLYLGLVATLAVQNVIANLTGTDSAAVFIATLILIIPALIGGRLLYFIWEGPRQNLSWRLALRRGTGGAILYGGLPLTLLLSLPLLSLLKIPFGTFWDITSFGILVGMIFTRVGCLLNGCCGGRPYSGPFALCLTNLQGQRESRIPSQLLEMILAVTLFILLLVIWPVRPFDGSLFLIGLAGYGLGRFLLEFTRVEQHKLFGPFGPNHFFSTALLIISMTLLILL